MQGQEPERSEIDGFFREIFSEEVNLIQYNAHPSEEILRSYLLGKVPTGWNKPEDRLNSLETDSPNLEWYRNDVTAHLITCRHCQRQIENLRTEVAESPSVMEWVSSAVERVRERLESIPRPALATIAVQSMIILLLGVFVASDALIDGSSMASLNGASASTNALPEPSRAIYSSQPTSDYAESFGQANEAERMRMARELSDSANVNWLPMITELMKRESDEAVLGVLGDAFNNSLAAINFSLGEAIDQIDDYRITSNQLAEFPDPNMINSLQRNLADLNRSVRKLNLSADLSVLSCEAVSQSLSLSAIGPILNEYAGSLIYDPQSQSSFEVQLPPLYAEQSIPRLQQAGLACQVY